MDETTDTPETTTKAQAVAKARAGASKNSTSVADDKEPTQDSVDPAASAEPDATATTPYAVLSGAEVDTITYSAAKPTGKTGPRRSLTVNHVQRRLYENGHTEAWAETIYGDLTRRSVSAWQEARGDEPTGILTRDQFEALFKGDPNVKVFLDTHEDHPVT